MILFGLIGFRVPPSFLWVYLTVVALALDERFLCGEPSWRWSVSSRVRVRKTQVTFAHRVTLGSFFSTGPTANVSSQHTWRPWPYRRSWNFSPCIVPVNNHQQTQKLKETKVCFCMKFKWVLRPFFKDDERFFVSCFSKTDQSTFSDKRSCYKGYEPAVRPLVTTTYHLTRCGALTW